MEAPQLDPTSLALPLSPQPENDSAETNSPSDDPNHAAPSKRDIHDTESALNISSDTLLALPQHVAVESSEEYTLDNRAATPVEVVPGTPDQLPLYEPPSVLASKILRAQDNPSPPPRSSLFSDYDDDVNYPDSRPQTPTPAALGNHDASIILAPQPSSDSASLVQLDNPNAPLILVTTEGPNSVEALLAVNSQSRSSSPGMPVPSISVGHIPSSEHVIARESTPALDIESKMASPSLSPRALEHSDSMDETPVRRSTRERRRPSRGPVELTAARSDDEALGVSPKPNAPMASPNRRKSRALFQGETTGFEAPPVIDSPRRAGSPSRKTTTGTSHRVLESLSPSASLTLANLIQAKEKEDPIELHVSQTPKKHSSGAPVFPRQNLTSPNKYRMRSPPAGSLQASPPRRSPVKSSEVLATSPRKGLVFANSTTPSQKPLAIGSKPPNSMSQIKAKPIRFGSPVRSVHERSRSAEPVPSAAPTVKGKQRSGSVEPIMVERPKATLHRPGQLAFPISKHETIQEEDETSKPSSSAPISSPSKSLLKAPSSTSKIPRINQKPYSRPIVSQSTKPPSSKPASGTRKLDFNKVQEPLAKTPSRGTLKPSVKPPSSSSSERKRAVAPPTTANSPLKRKRDHEPSISLSKAKTLSSAPHATQPTTRRKAIGADHTKKASTPHPVSSTIVPPPVSSIPSDVDTAVTLPSEEVAIDEPVQEQIPSAEPQSVEKEEEVPPPLVPEPVVPPAEPPVTEPIAISEDESSNSSIRRTTRRRQQLQPSHVVVEQPKPVERRKRARTPLIQDNGPFSNMSTVALRALTSSNTTKNQAYLSAKLVTEVVTKVGARPESPVMKSKSSSEKARDEMGEQRRARAERRAQIRSAGGASSGDEMPDMSADMDESIDTGYVRGPGEEEDYQTPERPSKRARFGSEDPAGPSQKDKKYVTWDRGYPPFVFVDEVFPRPDLRPKDVQAQKSCLSTSAKSLHLDTLGNVHSASTPLPLEQEDITVQKFVYEDDPVIELPTTYPQPSPVIVIRKTRSKSKKK